MTDPRTTDTGFAKQFVERCGDRFRWDLARGCWRVFEGGVWREDRVNSALYAALRAVVTDLFAAAGDAAGARALARGMAAPTQRHILDLAHRWPGMAVGAERWDADPWLFNVANGTLDLRTGELRASDAADLCTRQSPVAYDPSATAPRFVRFLDEIFSEDPALVAFVQRAVGYSLTGLTLEQVLFFLWGSGSNGKSELLKALRGLLGSYAVEADFTTFAVRRSDGAARNDLARLAGARLVVAVEAEQGHRLATATVKHVTGGDPITARFLFAEHFEYTPRFKLWLAANHKPEVKDTSEAFWRRIRLLPFERSFTGAARDTALGERLAAELPGVLAWAVEGAKAWAADGLGEPPRVVARATAYWRGEEDALGAFLAETTEGAGRVLRTEVHERYVAWMKARGEDWAAVLGQKDFNRELDARGYRRVKVRGERMWDGLSLVGSNGQRRGLPVPAEAF